MSEASPRICPKCQMPLEKAGSGSLTQWILVCNCGRPEAEKTAEPLNICAQCGKRVESGRSGTLTQWIFRADLCACDVPKLVGPEFATQADVGELDAFYEELSQLPELDVDSAKFPLERYSPLRLLGSGSAGSVYLCKDRLLDKYVAVKVLRVQSSEQLVAFQKEAKATDQLNHPKIAKILDFGVTAASAPYMVLDYVESISLEQLLAEREVLSLREAITIFVDICDALSYAHERAFYHRDLKPSNIIVVGMRTGALSARLIDFGVGAFMQDSATNIAGQTNTIAGTPAYMSPDLPQGYSFDARSEIYSLGCVLFEALTGQPPFSGETVLETLSMHAHNESPPLSEMCFIEYPDKVEDVVEICLKKDPDERYQTMEELKEAILDLQTELAPVEEVSPYMLTEFGDRKPKTRTKSILTILILVGTAIGAFGFYKSAPFQKPIVNTKKVETAPKLMDAVNALDGWSKARDMDGRISWASSPNESDEDLKYLRTKSQVESLTLALTDNLTGTGFKYLADQPIKSVTMQTTALTDEGMKELCKIKTLRKVRISLASGITLEGVKQLTTLPKLSLVAFNVMKMPKGACDVLATIKTLDVVSLYNTRDVTLKDIDTLQRSLPHLTWVDLTGTKMTNDVIPILAKWKRMVEIRLVHTNINDDRLDELATLPKLYRLDISRTDVSDEGLLKLASSKSLRNVNVDECPRITVRGANRLKRKNPNIRVTGIGSDANDGLIDALTPISE